MRSYSSCFPFFVVRRVRLLTVLVALSVTGCATLSRTSSESAGSAPRVISLRSDLLHSARQRASSGDTTLTPALAKLVRDADRLLTTPLVAVTDKRILLPPSGNPHDYFSLSPYWWPDPSKPDGLPYIRRDGVTNPDSKRDLDQPRVAILGSSVNTLALAYYFTGKPAYAERAAAQIRRWFLDSATRMTPHLRYAQLVRGNPAERGSGIIDTRWFIEVVDAAGLLQNSAAWTDADNAALQSWFRQYLAWLNTSPNGKHEHAAKNNHGSWFAAQTAAYAAFVGDSAQIRQIAQETRSRIGLQFRPDGSQPHELERTRSMHYSGFNVEALSRVAEVSRKAGLDLWTYRSPEGGSLRTAIAHLARYLGSDEKWPGQQIDPVDLDGMIVHLRRAELILGDADASAALRRLPISEVSAHRSTLLYPPRQP